MRSRLVIAPLAVVALAPALLGMGCTESPPSLALARTAVTAVPAPVTLMVVDTPGSGRVYTDPNGQVLYHYDGDNPATGAFGCGGVCLTVYPPMLVQPGTQVLLPSGMAGTPGTIVRPDTGGTQVTLNGQPLYRYSGDLPGDTNGIGPGWHAARAVSAPAS